MIWGLLHCPSKLKACALRLAPLSPLAVPLPARSSPGGGQGYQVAVKVERLKVVKVSLEEKEGFLCVGIV